MSLQPPRSPLPCPSPPNPPWLSSEVIAVFVCLFVQDGACGGDVTLEGMIRAGMLGIQLLPRSALKGVVLLTDGVSGFSSPSSMHTTVATMSSSNVSCWVVQVGGISHPGDTLGLVADVQTLNFMTRACNGCVIQPCKVSAVGSCLSSLSTCLSARLSACLSASVCLFTSLFVCCRSKLQ